MIEQLILVRHGETVQNVAGVAQGWNDSALSERGERQVAGLAGRLAAEGVDRLYSSPLGRAMATASAIAAATGREIVTVDGFREMNYGRWEGRSFLEVRRDDAEAYHRWIEDPAAACPGGESHEDVRRRIEAAVAELDPSSKRVVLVMHGTAIRIAATVLLGLPLSLSRQFAQDNAAMNVFLWRTDRYVLKRWNDTAHCGNP